MLNWLISNQVHHRAEYGSCFPLARCGKRGDWCNRDEERNISEAIGVWDIWWLINEEKARKRSRCDAQSLMGTRQGVLCFQCESAANHERDKRKHVQLTRRVRQATKVRHESDTLFIIRLSWMRSKRTLSFQSAHCRPIPNSPFVERATTV